jgi:hypothetical protein
MQLFVTETVRFSPGGNCILTGKFEFVICNRNVSARDKKKTIA